jgi:hypothetical protein
MPARFVSSSVLVPCAARPFTFRLVDQEAV